MEEISIFQNLIEDILFQKKNLLVQLNFLIKYMNLKENISLKPLSINVKNKVMDIVIGVPTNNFLYVNIYKEEIIGKISRYFYSKFLLSVTFIPVF
jgi:hypothetical protein